MKKVIESFDHYFTIAPEDKDTFHDKGLRISTPEQMLQRLSIVLINTLKTY